MMIRSALAVLLFATAADARDVLLQGKGKLALWRDGTIAWEIPWGGIHDLHRGDDGKIYVQKEMREVCAIDPAEEKVVWRFDGFGQFGNDVSNTLVVKSTSAPVSKGNAPRNSKPARTPTKPIWC